MITYHYKNYKIEIWKQKPNKEMNFENNDPNDTYGTHGYRVFNPKGKNIFEDNKDMWDEDACYQNACQDVDADLGDWKKEKKKEVADFFGGEVNGKV